MVKTVFSDLRHVPLVTVHEMVLAAMAHFDERLNRAGGALLGGMAARPDYDKTQSLVWLGGGFFNSGNLGRHRVIFAAFVIYARCWLAVHYRAILQIDLRNEWRCL
jgi:hypothetical protein